MTIHRCNGGSCTLRDRGDADMCRRRGWGPGTRLVGDGGSGSDTIEITALGARRVSARTIRGDESNPGMTPERLRDRESSWLLNCRCWTEVDPGPAKPAHQSTDRERARHQVEHLRNILAAITIDLRCEGVPPGHDRAISLTAAAHSLAITLARIEVAERSRGAEPADVRLDVAMDDVEEGDA